jgi:hypothetical protein
MKRILFACVFLSLFSCKKETSKSVQSVAGKWARTNLIVDTYSGTTLTPHTFPASTNPDTLTFNSDNTGFVRIGPGYTSAPFTYSLPSLTLTYTSSPPVTWNITQFTASGFVLVNTLPDGSETWNDYYIKL